MVTVTSPPENITIKCPECRHIYEDWYRPSINLTLEDFDDDYLEEASTATCPVCKHKVRLGVLVVRNDGVWEFSGNKVRRSET